MKQKQKSIYTPQKTTTFRRKIQFQKFNTMTKLNSTTYICVCFITVFVFLAGVLSPEEGRGLFRDFFALLGGDSQLLSSESWLPLDEVDLAGCCLGGLPLFFVVPLTIVFLPFAFDEFADFGDFTKISLMLGCLANVFVLVCLFCDLVLTFASFCFKEDLIFPLVDFVAEWSLPLFAVLSCEEAGEYGSEMSLLGESCLISSKSSKFGDNVSNESILSDSSEIIFLEAASADFSSCLKCK